jgi:hypothetical protein
MALRDHVQIDVVATLVCAGCGDICDASDSNERSAESLCLGNAEAEGWMELGGKVRCKSCIESAADAFI